MHTCAASVFSSLAIEACKVEAFGSAGYATCFMRRMLTAISNALPDFCN